MIIVSIKQLCIFNLKNASLIRIFLNIILINPA